MTEQNKKSLKKLVLSGMIIVLIVVALYFIFKALGFTDMKREDLQKIIAETGAVAPLAFIGITIAQVTLIPIPGAVTILAGSYIFGFWQSFVYSYIGMMIGSVLSFVLGRLIGKPYVNWVAGGKEQAEDWIKKLKGREKVFLFFAFLLPFFPDDILCAVAGALPIKWLTFIIMQFITRITSILGTMLFMSGEIIPFHGWGLIVLGVIGAICVVAFILSIKYSVQLNAFFDKIINKFSRKKVKNND